MMIRLAAAAALIAVATPAAAVTVISSTPGAPDPGPPPGLMTVVTFDSALPAGIVNTTTGDVYTGPNAGAHPLARAIPAGTTTNFQAVQIKGSSTFDFTNFYFDGRALSKFSLYWGSIDDYNKISFLKSDGTLVQSFTGAAFPPADGGQRAAASNRRITFGFTQAEAVAKVRFESSKNAFEYDTLAIAVVPEPATWAMMILGFGLVGGAMRRRPAQTRAFA